MKYLKTLNEVHTRLDRLGDLPVFSATINHIQQISSARESNAMALAMAVMKDANLSAKLLKLANSAHVNRGKGRINVISRAVVLIGFDEIKNLSVTLKLIESFSKRNPQVDIGQLVLSSFMNASIARDLAAKTGVDDIEETYTCGLLYSLGEIVVAYTLPEVYNRMLDKRRLGNASWSRIQLDELGGHFSDIGQDLAQGWGFPKAVVNSMDEMTAEELHGDHKRNHQLASASHRLLELIYNNDPSRGNDFTQQLHLLSKITGLPDETLNSTVTNAFRMVCDLSEDYGISSKRLIPPVENTGDEQLDEFNRKMAFYIHSRDENLSNTADTAPLPPEGSPSLSEPQSQRLKKQLQYLQEISAMVTDQAPVPKVLMKAIEAIQESSGCTRVGFCLLDKSRRQLSLKLVCGTHTEPLKDYFTMSRQGSSEFFFRLIEKQSTLLVTDTDEPGWSDRLPACFMQRVNPCGFILAPLGVGQKAIGFLYADRSLAAGPINDDDFRCFNQFHMQTRMALGYSHSPAGAK